MKKSLLLKSLAGTALFSGLPLAAATVKTACKNADKIPSGAITPFWWIAPVCAVVALLGALLCYRLMIRAPKGNSTMEEIAGFVKEGAMAYLRQQYSRVGLVFVILFIVFAVLAVIGVPLCARSDEARTGKRRSKASRRRGTSRPDSEVRREQPRSFRRDADTTPPLSP